MEGAAAHSEKIDFTRFLSSQDFVPSRVDNETLFKQKFDICRRNIENYIEEIYVKITTNIHIASLIAIENKKYGLTSLANVLLQPEQLYDNQKSIQENMTNSYKYEQELLTLIDEIKNPELYYSLNIDRMEKYNLIPNEQSINIFNNILLNIRTNLLKYINPELLSILNKPNKPTHLDQYFLNYPYIINGKNLMDIELNKFYPNTFNFFLYGTMAYHKYNEYFNDLDLSVKELNKSYDFDINLSFDFLSNIDVYGIIKNIMIDVLDNKELYQILNSNNLIETNFVNINTIKKEELEELINEKFAESFVAIINDYILLTITYIPKLVNVYKYNISLVIDNNGSYYYDTIYEFTFESREDSEVKKYVDSLTKLPNSNILLPNFISLLKINIHSLLNRGLSSGHYKKCNKDLSKLQYFFNLLERLDYNRNEEIFKKLGFDDKIKYINMKKIFDTVKGVVEHCSYNPELLEQKRGEILKILDTYRTSIDIGFPPHFDKDESLIAKLDYIFKNLDDNQSKVDNGIVVMESDMKILKRDIKEGKRRKYLKYKYKYLQLKNKN